LIVTKAALLYDQKRSEIFSPTGGVSVGFVTPLPEGTAVEEIT
jgi:hypothetical protein